MSEMSSGTGRGPSHRSVEIGVAAATGLFGIIAMIGSYEVGIGWAIEGPRSGFFPFYIGVVVVISSLVNLGMALMEKAFGELFAD